MQVRGVVLIDTPVPLNHNPLPEAVIEYLASPASTRKHFRSASGSEPSPASVSIPSPSPNPLASGSKSRSRSPEAAKNSVAFLFQWHAQLLSKHQMTPLSDIAGLNPHYVMLQSSDNFPTSKLCGVAYPWFESDAARHQATEQWREAITRGGGKMTVLMIPGNHFEPFLPENVSVLLLDFLLGCFFSEYLSLVSSSSSKAIERST